MAYLVLVPAIIVKMIVNEKRYLLDQSKENVLSESSTICWKRVRKCVES